MNLLAIDTSGDSCSAALYWSGRVEQRLELAPRRHGELILAMMDGLLESAGIALGALGTIAFGRGPGSFTGVRIACAVAQGAAFGAGLPTVPVSTLAAIAQGVHRRDGGRRLLVALDARMGEVYWGAFNIAQDGIARPCGPELVCPPGEVPVPDGQGWRGVGSGWGAYAQALGSVSGTAWTGPPQRRSARPGTWCPSPLLQPGPADSSPRSWLGPSISGTGSPVDANCFFGDRSLSRYAERSRGVAPNARPPHGGSDV
jgi:tRNA threonylcarbamoyladenosine biosynthesis protein TsaB